MRSWQWQVQLCKPKKYKGKYKSVNFFRVEWKEALGFYSLYSIHKKNWDNRRIILWLVTFLNRNFYYIKAKTKFFVSGLNNNEKQEASLIVEVAKLLFPGRQAAKYTQFALLLSLCCSFFTNLIAIYDFILLYWRNIFFVPLELWFAILQVSVSVQK